MEDEWPEAQSETSIDFVAAQKRIFTEKEGKIYIGGIEVTAQIRDVLREQAQYILTSNLWEVLNASIINESGNLALKQSKDFGHVRFAKALDYWRITFQNIVDTLAK